MGCWIPSHPDSTYIRNIVPSTYSTKGHQLKTHVGTPLVRLIFAFKLPPFKAATKLPTWPILVQFFHQVPKTTVTAHLCPPCLSTMTRRVYTSRLSFPQWHGLTQTHFPPRSRKTAWHSDITFRKLYIVVSLMKNHYSNKGFCRGKGRPFDLAFC